MITPEIRNLIERNTIGFVATITPEGRPAVSPTGTTIVLSETSIVFSDIRSPGTARNIQHSPFVELNFIDVLSRKGCRVGGVAAYVAKSDSQFADYQRHFQKWPTLVERMRGFVVVTVESAQMLRSPVYDLGAIESDLIAHWRQYYTEQSS